MRDYFLRLGDVPGTSMRLGCEDALEILSLAWGTSREPEGGTSENLSITRYTDSSTPLIVALLQANQRVDAVLTCLTSTGQDDVELVRMTLGDARVTGLSISGSAGDGPVESLTLEYGSLNIGVTRVSPEGIPLETVQYGYECEAPAPAPAKE